MLRSSFNHYNSIIIHHVREAIKFLDNSDYCAGGMLAMRSNLSGHSYLVKVFIYGIFLRYYTMFF